MLTALVDPTAWLCVGYLYTLHYVGRSTGTVMNERVAAEARQLEVVWTLTTLVFVAVICSVCSALDRGEGQGTAEHGSASQEASPSLGSTAKADAGNQSHGIERLSYKERCIAHWHLLQGPLWCMYMIALSLLGNIKTWLPPGSRAVHFTASHLWNAVAVSIGGAASYAAVKLRWRRRGTVQVVFSLFMLTVCVRRPQIHGAERPDFGRASAVVQVLLMVAFSLYLLQYVICPTLVLVDVWASSGLKSTRHLFRWSGLVMETLKDPSFILWLCALPSRPENALVPLGAVLCGMLGLLLAGMLLRDVYRRVTLAAQRRQEGNLPSIPEARRVDFGERLRPVDGGTRRKARWYLVQGAAMAMLTPREEEGAMRAVMIPCILTSLCFLITAAQDPRCAVLECAANALLVSYYWYYPEQASEALKMPVSSTDGNASESLADTVPPYGSEAKASGADGTHAVALTLSLAVFFTVSAFVLHACYKRAVRRVCVGGGGEVGRCVAAWLVDPTVSFMTVCALLTVVSVSTKPRGVSTGGEASEPPTWETKRVIGDVALLLLCAAAIAGAPAWRRCCASGRVSQPPQEGGPPSPTEAELRRARYLVLYGPLLFMTTICLAAGFGEDSVYDGIGVSAIDALRVLMCALAYVAIVSGDQRRHLIEFLATGLTAGTTIASVYDFVAHEHKEDTEKRSTGVGPSILVLGVATVGAAMMIFFVPFALFCTSLSRLVTRRRPSRCVPETLERTPGKEQRRVEVQPPGEEQGDMGRQV